ncbi:hypothetical protein LXA43DRAFT_886753 [Ganoderma leucocontextum]|nr:hypothetical protein LXA43DRAFT_886753 [Ganoderma leucocontextum]
MTRYTNFARRQTYVQAGFDNEPQAKPDIANPEPKSTSGETSQEPEAKKRKRLRSRKTKFSDVDVTAAGGNQTEGDAADDGEGEEPSDRPSKKAKFGDKGKRWNKFDKRYPKGQRRVKRINDRHSDTICFACREKGHTARDCTNTIATDALEREQSKSKSGRDTVGICYRCGSRRHNLSKCNEPVNPENPLPFASCFVCSGKGHLASKCPKNQSKGIYPNGGCCKLCKETSHLAKDCPMRQPDVVAKTVFVGTGHEGGADEDDFHTFKRKTQEVEKVEKMGDKARRKAEVKVAAHSGVVKAFGDAAPDSKKKNVVFF